MSSRTPRALPSGAKARRHREERNTNIEMYEISIKSSFSSAHQLKGYDGVCENLHGHNWKAEVFVRTNKLDEIGLGIDYKILEEHTDNILKELDHKNINEVVPFDKINPSSENIAQWLYKKLSDVINTENLKVFRVKIKETESFSAYYSEE